MLELKIKDVAVAALAALRANELQKQKNPKAAMCRYSGPCAIGAALSPENRKMLDEVFGEDYSSPTIGMLVVENIVRVDDYMAFTQIQVLHDRGDLKKLEEYLLKCIG